MMRFHHLACIGVTLSFGCGEVVDPGAFSADAAPQPTATSINPDRGPIVGGIDVTISGTGFLAAEGDVTVLVGGVRSPSATADSDGEVTFELPPGLVENAVVDVTVFNQNGHVTLPEAFTYNPRPIILSVDPVLARKAGSTNFTIKGRGFEELDAGTPTVTINGVAAVGVTVVDDETITAINGADITATPGDAADLVVTNANGSDSLDQAVTLTAPGLLAMGRYRTNPVVYYIDPTTGNVKLLFRLPTTVSICALSPSGVLFARSGNSQAGHTLVTVDLENKVVTPVGRIRDGADLDRRLFAMTFVGSTLYGIDRDLQRLVTVNQTTGVLTPVVAPPGGSAITNYGAIAIKDGTAVYYAQLLSGTLDTVSTSASTRTAGPSMAGTSTSYSHGMVTIGSTTYISEYGGSNRVFSVNATTGLLTPVATLPSQIAGICETPPTF